MKTVERLVACAIQRNGVLHKGGREGHYLIRHRLGDEHPDRSKPGDIDGFITSEDTFVDRSKAVDIGQEAGQVTGNHRELTSGDIHWDGKPPVLKSRKKKLLFRP